MSGRWHLTRTDDDRPCVVVDWDETLDGHLIGADLMELFEVFITMTAERLPNRSVRWTFVPSPLLVAGEPKVPA